ncbi:hypothetical protein AB0O34_00910 [Sphaerisporangium sp. NPDC088356]
MANADIIESGHAMATLTCCRIQFVVRDVVGHGIAEAGSRKA